MIVFYNKKLFLRKHYNNIFSNNSLVLFCQLNNIKLLPKLRNDLLQSGLSLKVLKNNMAKKILLTNRSIFLGTTVCLYGDKLNLSLLKLYLFNKSEVFVIIAKIGNYLVRAEDLDVLLLKFNLENHVLMYNGIKMISNSSVLVLNYLIKIYLNLFKICQR